MAEERTEAARKMSHQAVVDVDDLDVIQTPEKCVLVAPITAQTSLQSLF